MKREIWVRMKDLFLDMQYKMLEVQSQFNEEAGFQKKYDDTQLSAIKEKLTALEKSFHEDYEALKNAVENPVKTPETASAGTSQSSSGGTTQTKAASSSGTAASK